MGEQLDLFGNKPAKPAEPAPVVQEEEAPVAATPESLPGQMDLFGDRWQRAAAAHKALQSFDLEGAADGLREAVKSYPTDTSLIERVELVTKLAKTLRGARRKAKSPARALAAIEPKVPEFLAEYWHRRLAELMEDEGGAGAVLDGVPAGLHWLRAGDPARAEESLRATLEREPLDCRARGYLADALFVQERQPEARKEYRQALSLSPEQVDIRHAADIAVRDLPSVAEEDFELPGEPVEWAVAVGLIAGLFLPPSHLPDDWVEPAALEKLPAGVQFYRWLVAEKVARDDAQRIACRRAMKALSPRLIKEVVGSR